MLLYSDKATYTFLPYRKRGKTREACADRCFFRVERVARREKKTGNCLLLRDTQMFCRSDRRATKRPFVFDVEKGRAATPASFSQVKIMRKEGEAEGKKVQVKKKTFAFFRIEFIPSFFSFSFFFTKIY